VINVGEIVVVIERTRTPLPLSSRYNGTFPNKSNKSSAKGFTDQLRLGLDVFVVLLGELTKSQAARFNFVCSLIIY